MSGDVVLRLLVLRGLVYVHRGCGGRIKRLSTGERLVLLAEEGYDVAKNAEWSCEKCGALFPEDYMPVGGGFRITPPRGSFEEKKMEFFLTLTEEEIRDIIKEAYIHLREHGQLYKDGGKTKDEQIIGVIDELLEEMASKRFGAAAGSLKLPQWLLLGKGRLVLEKAEELGLVETVKEVRIEIPYAYKKRGRFRGIKSVRSWKVIRFSPSILKEARESGQEVEHGPWGAS